MTLESLVAAAVAEDIGPGDWTTLWTVPADARSEAVIVAKEPLVVAGMDAVVEVFRQVEPEVSVEVVVPNGARADTEEVLTRLDGPTRGLLTAERVALNFLGRLSGIATLTRRFVDLVEGTGAKVIDTRKTTPGFRHLEKAAVVAGGGTNHRMGLHDMVLIKDNHVASAGGVGLAIRHAMEHNDRGIEIEAEVNSLDELDEALRAGAGRILLDNMDAAAMRTAVERCASDFPDVVLEASGNVDLARVRGVAETGVHRISVGALTHSAPYADVSMRIRR